MEDCVRLVLGLRLLGGFLCEVLLLLELLRSLLDFPDEGMRVLHVDFRRGRRDAIVLQGRVRLVVCVTALLQGRILDLCDVLVLLLKLALLIVVRIGLTLVRLLDFGVLLLVRGHGILLRLLDLGAASHLWDFPVQLEIWRGLNMGGHKFKP